MMTIPFLGFLKKKGAKEPPVEAVKAPLPVIEKPSADRLGKTVLPNATRTAVSAGAFQPQANVQSESGRRAYSLGGSSAANRMIDLPPAVALAIEPKVERVIALPLSQIIQLIPDGFARPVSEAEGSRPILLKAAELEKGMASGKPSVSVASIFKQVPEIFVRKVDDGDPTQTVLPFDKVLEQFKKLHLRSDQTREQSVPQVETPFLKVTLEDNTKFGIASEPVQLCELPAPRIQIATAENYAAAEPEWIAREKVELPTSIPLTPLSPKHSQNNLSANGSAAVEPPPVPSTPKIEPPPTPVAPPAPARIPFKLSPTGPDAPASESVPASCGPSVPTGNGSAAPARIPFKLGAAKEGANEKAQWLTKDNFDGEAKASAPVETSAPAIIPAAKSGPKISLPLKAVLQGLPPFQLAGDIDAVAESDLFELPFALIEPQLATGRVGLTPDEFSAALPEKFKTLFSAKEIATPVALVLQDVLKNLPSTSLRIRDDQEEQEKGEEIATPFSAKAEEDAKRFNLNTTVATKPLRGPKVKQAKPAIPKPAVATPVSVPLEKPALPAGRTALQKEFDTDEEVDAKAVVAHVGKMPDVKACAIMFADGLSLAGNLPEEFQADGLCAMAPSLLQRVGSHMLETKLGELRAMTLSCAQAAITFFMQDNLCLAAMHAKAELAAEVRERLARTVHELAKKYSHPV